MSNREFYGISSDFESDLEAAREEIKFLNSKRKRYYEESLSIPIKKRQKRNENLSDPETHFSLSLVPMLKMLPEEQKLDVQIKILKIFKTVKKPESPISHTYTNNKSNTTNQNNMFRSKPLNFSSFPIQHQQQQNKITSSISSSPEISNIHSSQNESSLQSYISTLSESSNDSHYSYDSFQ